MAFTIPTTKDLAAQFLAAIEARINQTTPPVARAFNRVLSGALALFGTGVYKYATDRSLQALALTATGEGLDTIGENYGVTRKAAVAAVLELTQVAVNGTLIPSGTVFVSNSTAEEYVTVADVTAALGVAVLNAAASTPGEVGNLANAELLTIGTPIAGAATTAEVTDTITVGADRETDTYYRRRVLTQIRAAGGGANSADLRRWAEEVPDVLRAFPYAGKPRTFYVVDEFDFGDGGGGGPYTITYSGVDPAFDFADYGFHADGVVTVSGANVPANNGSFGIVTVGALVLTTVGPLTADADDAGVTLINESLPGDRTVYVESRSDLEECPVATLDDVREALLTDPETGLSRQPLGLVEDRLYVESICGLTLGSLRQDVALTITGIVAPAEVLAEAKTKVETALRAYLYACACFVDGLDYPGDRTDTITTATLGAVIQGVLRQYGASIEKVEMVLRAPVDAYQLLQGELVQPTVGVGFITWA